MSRQIDRDGEWTRIAFLEDWDTASQAVLRVRDAGVTLLSDDRWRTWDYTVELVVSESGETDDVPAGEYIVASGHDLGTPVDVFDPMRALESLASFADHDREHIEYAERERYGADCPEDGEKC